MSDFDAVNINTGHLQSKIKYLESERDSLLQTLAKERDGFGKREIEIIRERDALKAELEAQYKISVGNLERRERCAKELDHWRGIAEKMADAAGAITESIAFTEGTKTNSEMPKWLLARGEDLKKALSLYHAAAGK